MPRSASGYGFKEHVAGFRNELKVLDAFLAQIRRLSWCHRSWHVAHERDAPLFAGSSDCKIALSRARPSCTLMKSTNGSAWKPFPGESSWRLGCGGWLLLAEEHACSALGFLVPIPPHRGRSVGNSSPIGLWKNCS